MNVDRMLAWTFLFALLLCGCPDPDADDDSSLSPSPSGEIPTDTPDAATPTGAPAFTPEPTFSQTPESTPTLEPAPTLTPGPTMTPIPTTPGPTATPTGPTATPPGPTTTPTPGPTSTPTPEPTATPVPDRDGDGYTEAEGDCNDHEPTIHPDAEDFPYDGVDQDCDGADLTDVDQDGFDGLEAAGGDDCDDTDPNTHPDADEFADGKDNDCDGTIDEGLDITDDDLDGYSEAEGDCDDADPLVAPGLEESCNEVDDNCDGSVDEGVLITFYRDRDEDGYGDSSQSTQACSAPEGWVEDATGGVALDCDDRNREVHPGATELCNGRDDDCDSEVDESLGSYTYYRDEDEDDFGKSGDTTTSCGVPPTGYVSVGQDCDDSNPAVNPSATETCNARDDDCDGEADEGIGESWFRDADGDGYGDASSPRQACLAPTGFVADSSDCDDSDEAIYPGAVEACNLLDDDCDGEKDEGVKTAYYYDADGDGFGRSSSQVMACAPPSSGYVTSGDDCNDLQAAICPGAQEACNTLDDDCDGQIDEEGQAYWYRDGDGDGYGDIADAVQACSPPAGYTDDGTDCDDENSDVFPGANEVCNGLDDDCDEMIDVGPDACIGCQNGLCPLTEVRDGSVEPDVDLYYQYSPVTEGDGFLKANWDVVAGATSYRLRVGDTPGGDEILEDTDVGDETSFEASGLSLEGAWNGAVYYVTVTPEGPSGIGQAATSNGAQIAELELWDGSSLEGLRNEVDGGYVVDFPSGSGWDVVYGHHYFETVRIAADTVVHVAPFGRADSVPAGISNTDTRVVSPRDGWLALHANEVTVEGTIDAAGRGYGGAGGAGVNNSSSGGGQGGSSGLSGDGASAGGKGRGAGGGGGSGGVKGGDGGPRGGGGGGATCTEVGDPGSDSGGGRGGDGAQQSGGPGGTNPYGGGRGGQGQSSGSDCSNDGAGGGGAGYGAGGGGGVYVGSGGGGGGSGGGSGYGSFGLGPGQKGGSSGAAPQQPGLPGGYGQAGANSDTSEDMFLLLGSGGGGGGQLGPGCNPCEGGGGGGAGGGAILLMAIDELTVGSSGQLVTVGASGGAGAGQDSRGGSGGGGGGGGGGILLCGKMVDVADGAVLDARGGAAGGSGGYVSGISTGGNGGDGGARSENGGTLKLFYDIFSGTLPSSDRFGRVYDAGPDSGRCAP